jgi:dephospho-CoA kinase
MKIIGIGGMPRSGKDSLAELFIKDGFFGISFGDVVRRFARERHADKPDPISVTNMTETSNWLRENHGPEIILDEALQQYKDQVASGHEYQGLVLWSIRMPVEVDYILERNGELIWTEASVEVRHQRNLKHMREGEAPVTIEEFKAQEALQWVPQPGIDPNIQMNMSYVKAHATRILENNQDDFTVFLKKAHALIAELGITE